MSKKQSTTKANRQIELLESKSTSSSKTRLYDADKDHTRSIRNKEDANDYRYFTCPDLLPVEITDTLLKLSKFITRIT